MMRNILELSTTKALDYFLQPTNYSTLSLPIYFSFDKILKFVKIRLEKRLQSMFKRCQETSIRL